MIGAARAQGAEVEIPSLAEARAHFDEWVLGDDEADFSTDNMIIKRALGLSSV